MPLLDLSAELLRPVGELERGTQATGGPLGPGAVPEDEVLAIVVACAAASASSFSSAVSARPT